MTDVPAMRRCQVVATFLTPTLPPGAPFPEAAGWIALRADLLGDAACARLQRRARRPCLYSLRSTPGCPGDEDDATRTARLVRAAKTYDLVELDVLRDLRPAVLAAVPPEQRMLAWYGAAASATALEQRWAGMAAVPAACYKIVPHALHPTDGLAPLALLRRLNRTDLVAYAEGEAGAWTRVLAAYLGSPFVFGTPSNDPSPHDPGALCVSQLHTHYGLPELQPVTTVFGIAGTSVLHSLAPLLHNEGYRVLGLKARYLPFKTTSEDLSWLPAFAGHFQDRLGLDLPGLTVVSPHKQAVVRAAGRATSSDLSWSTQAANNIVRRNGQWHTHTDGASSLMEPIRAHQIPVAGRRAAVVGCGGAGRPAAVALASAGAHVTLVNRSLDRGQWAAALLGLPFLPLTTFAVDDFDLIVHATPVGKRDGEVLFPLDGLREGAAVVDLVYRAASQTALVEQVRAKGREAVTGREILAASVRRQFHLLTGKDLPASALRSVVPVEQPAAVHQPS